MKAKDLRNSILQMAVQGKLVPQDPNDEPASALLERIRAERARLIKEKKIKASKGGESVIYRASDGSHYEKRGNGEPVCIDDEIPFEIPENWEWARLESLLADIIVPIRDKPAKLDGPIPWCRIEDVEGRYLSRSRTNQGIDESTVERMNLKVYPVGTVLCSNSATIGVPAIIQNPCVTNQRFIGFLPATGLTTPYLYLLFLAFNKALTTVGTGTTHAYISRGKFEQLIVPLPPTREQDRIINAFDEIEAIIEDYGALEDARERLDVEFPDRLRKSILQLAVQGRLVEQDPADEPASALLDRIRAERAALVKAKKLKTPKGGESVIYRASDGGYYEKRGKGDPQPIEVPFDVPDTWEWVRLKTMGEIVGGGTPKTHDASLWATSDNGVPWITPADMKNVHGRRVSHGERYLSEKGLAGSSAQLMPAGTVVMSSRAPIGYLAIAECPVATNQGFKSVVPTLVDTNAWIMLSLDALMDDIKKRATGTTFKEISGSEFGETLVPLPPLPEQARIIDCSARTIAVIG